MLADAADDKVVEVVRLPHPGDLVPVRGDVGCPARLGNQASGRVPEVQLANLTLRALDAERPLIHHLRAELDAAVALAALEPYLELQLEVLVLCLAAQESV